MRYSTGSWRMVKMATQHFDYDKNDKLAGYYRRNAVLREDLRFVLDTTLVWPKPSTMKDRSFRGPCTYVFEDFHHLGFRLVFDTTL